MSMGLASEPAVLATFDRVVALVCASGSGMTLRQLSTASALARELCRAECDQGKVEDHAHALGIDLEALNGTR